mgnify:CR=1 FL=1
MNIYDRLGVRTLINAVDTYTAIGGSLIPAEVMDAMVEASKYFVSIEELQDKAGERIARLTRNESACVTSGAAAGLALATAACVTGENPALAARLPDTRGMKNEVIIHRCQRNGYDHAVRQIGVQIVEIGFVDGTHPWELEAAINERTACIVYFAASVYSRGALPLEQVIEIGNKHGVPVIVDAAAQLPPVENLWKYTELGAAAAIFSGGKTLRGPQSTGLVVGKSSLIRACRVNANPRHSIGRSMKLGKEEIVGLLAAVERYVSLDHEQTSETLERCVREMGERMALLGLRTKRLYPGPVGQTYPRLAVYPDNKNGWSAERLQAELAAGTPGIMVGLTEDKHAVIVNPLQLTEEEVRIVMSRIRQVIETKPGSNGAPF